jgi:hypothetical protein
MSGNILLKIQYWADPRGLLGRSERLEKQLEKIISNEKTAYKCWGKMLNFEKKAIAIFY